MRAPYLRFIGLSKAVANDTGISNSKSQLVKNTNVSTTERIMNKVIKGIAFKAEQLWLSGSGVDDNVTRFWRMG